MLDGFRPQCLNLANSRLYVKTIQNESSEKMLGRIAQVKEVSTGLQWIAGLYEKLISG